MLYSFLDVVLGILFRIFLRLEVHGAENIPKTGPLVIASNHLSLLDPPVIGGAFYGQAGTVCAGAGVYL